MKKILCFLMIMTLALTMLLVACNQQQQSGEQGEGQKENLYKSLMWDESLGDKPYDLYFSSNGDGTCSVKSIIFNPKNNQPFTVEIPEKSPAGETVIEIAFSPIMIMPEDLPFNIPVVIAAETFETLCKKMEENGMEGFDYNRFTAYYLRLSLEGCNEQEQRELLEAFPFLVGGDVYSFHSTASPHEITRISAYFQQYSDWNDEKTIQCYNEILESVQQSDMLEQTKLFFLRLYYDKNLELISSITIPDSVASIGSHAFSGCTGLTSITISDSVTEIGDCAFQGCTGLTSITIPDSVTSIGDLAFSGCSGLTSITIPDSVISIGGSAFSGCSGLTSISIPNSVTSIGGDVFFGCTGLTDISVGENNTTYFSQDGILYSKADTGILAVPKKIVGDVTIADGVTTIAQCAFENCTGLTSITIPDSVTEIGPSAFRGCTSLTSITIPDSVISIGDSAFLDCTGMTSITIGNGVKDLTGFFFHNYPNLAELIIGNGVTEIGESAFSDCTGLTSITIPDSVEKIGYLAFAGCTGLTSITIPDSVENIGNSAFAFCTGLTSITIPNSVENIGDSAFAGCTGLTKVTIPYADTNSQSALGLFNSVFNGCTSIREIVITGGTSIGNWAFAGCIGLTSITIPDSVTSIGDWAFDGCTGLTSITIPDSVTSVGAFAFDNCTGLTSITIPDSITCIGGQAFYGCTNLTDIYYSGTAARWAEISAIAYVPETATIHYNYVPEE